jgi:WD40 repeat protein
MFCAGCLDGTVHLAPALQSALGTALPHPSAVTTVEFGDADGRTMVATACMDGNVRLWDPVQPSAPRVGVEGHIGSVAFVARDGETVDVLTVNDKAQLQWWSGDDGRRVLHVDIAGKRPAPIEKLGPGARPTATVAAGYVDGRLIALTSYEGTIQVLEFGGPERNEPRVIREYASNDRTWRPTALHVDNDQALFATIEDWSAPTRVYDALTGRPMTPRPPWESDSSVLGFHSLGGRTWLAVTDNRGLSLFDVEDGTALGAPVEVNSGSREITIALGTLEGEQVLAVFGWGQLRLCDAKAGTDRIAPIHTSPTARAVAFAMLGQRDVVLTAHFATVRVWNPFTGRRLAQLPFGTNIDAMAVHSSQDGTVRVAVGGPGLLLTELHE